MTEENLQKEEAGSEIIGSASEKQGNSETTENINDEQPVTGVNLPEKFQGKSLEEIAKSAIEAEKLQTRTAEERNLLAKKTEELQQQIELMQKKTETSPDPNQEEAKQAFINRLNKALKGDNPAEVVLGLMKGMAEKMSVPQQVDPDLLDMKEERLLNKNLNAMNDPLALKHKDDIRKIMIENNFPASNPKAIEFAWSKWRTDNLAEYIRETDVLNTKKPTGGTPVSTHEEATKNIVDEKSAPLNLSPEDSARLNTFINHGVYKDKEDFKKASKMIDNLPSSTHLKGGVTVGNPRE